MKDNDRDYEQEAKSDAQDMARNFIDEIVTFIVEDGEVSNDLFNDYPSGDSYHHETHVDRAYDLLEAANLLDDLSNYEETDSGLWDGQKPREAIATQAAFTYGNAVMSLWVDLIKEINDDEEIITLGSDHEGAEDTAKAELLKRNGEEDEEELDEDEVEAATEKLKEEIKVKITARVNTMIDAF